MEIVLDGGSTLNKTHIGAQAVVLQTFAAQSTYETQYLLKDHLGSTDVILDATGAALTRMSFDAWGKRREVQWAAFVPSVPASLWQSQRITKGYTGHEQLDPVGLVHMNGRVYDPEIGRFLSADPHIQDVTNGQALNRYSYVLNNPLSYTDPSGFFFQSLFKAIGRALGAVFRAIGRVFNALLKSGIFRAIVQIAACAGYTSVGAAALCAGLVSSGLTLASGGSVADALKAGAISAAQVAVFRAVGATFGGEDIFTQTAVHGTVSGAFSVAQGGEFHTGFISGAVAKGASLTSEPGTDLGEALGAETSVARTAFVATVGGTASVLSGGKFANGAVTAAFAHLYNGLKGRLVGTLIGARLGKAKLGGQIGSDIEDWLFKERAPVPLKNPVPVDPNKLHHIFGAPKHQLDDLLQAFNGSADDAFLAVRDAANQALKDGKLVVGRGGILPGGQGGAILEVRGIKVQMVGGIVKDGQVTIGSFSRQWLK